MEKGPLIPAALFLLALGTGILTMPSHDTLTYDGALYIDIARNLAQDPTSFTYQGIYMMYRPPLYPYTLSIAYHFVQDPPGQLTVARLISVIFFAFTAVLTYLLVVEMCGEGIKGVLASLFYTFNPLAFTMGTRELVHSEFTFFYTLAVYLLYTGRKKGDPLRIYLAFISAGAAILTRYTGLSILAVFLAYLWLSDHWEWVRKREYWIGALLLLLVLAPWLYLGELHYGGALRPFSVASKVVTLDKPVSLSDYLRLLLEDLGVLLPLLAVLGFLRIQKNEEGWLLISWLFMGLMGILTVVHKETRFVTFLSPVVAILAAEGVLLIRDGIASVLGKRTTGATAYKVLAVVLAILFLAPTAEKALALKETWDKFGNYESRVLSYASEEYPREKLLVSPRLYTMAGFYYPGAEVDMALDRQDVRGRIASGYYDLIILQEPANHLNIEESGNYVLVREFYGGKFKIYLRKEN
ncbi:glycosyl transferase family protein 6 [Thermococcus cleftensis]|uniref:Glycosyl transferase family protein 6 n=1 Tax=Thermococcus cleftensis (strain DSM 27260 / KACC 17922 / CL1) TaxID=163003 RepID=I3ZSN1_THECF|nr:glycosyltransferase family 39 protein [Thermococcus cleftensis]AFL94715.1 glycosyl transferase family protein 6 [Thermococcus cleftensis]